MEVLFDIQPEPLAERVVRVHRGGRRHGRAAAAGVSVDRQRRMPSRDQGRGRQCKLVCRRDGDAAIA
jgi:hypothetical protein